MPSSSATRKLLARIYGALIKARNLLYDAGILKARAVPGVVVSVGNVEAGGTGKTPFAMALAAELASRGLATCIVTRGYKGSCKDPLVVKKNHTSDEVGDEALLMARSLSVPVIKSPDRVKGCSWPGPCSTARSSCWTTDSSTAGSAATWTSCS